MSTPTGGSPAEVTSLSETWQTWYLEDLLTVNTLASRWSNFHNKPSSVSMSEQLPDVLLFSYFNKEDPSLALRLEKRA